MSEEDYKYEAFFYENSKGECPIGEYIEKLASKNDKDSRIKLNKIYDHINYLRREGLQAKKPYAEHLSGEIWELKPIRDRILYAEWNEKSYILLHLFMKATRKTPKREIEQAKRNLSDYRERSEENENDESDENQENQQTI